MYMPTHSVYIYTKSFSIPVSASLDNTDTAQVQTRALRNGKTCRARTVQVQLTSELDPSWTWT